MYRFRYRSRIPSECFGLFGVTVEQALLQRGMTAAWLGRRIGTGRATCYNIINGRRRPSLEMALMIARTLDLSLDEIFGLKPQPQLQDCGQEVANA